MSAERRSRADGARMSLARAVVEAVAVDNGVCVRPVPIRRVDTETGEHRLVDVPGFVVDRLAEHLAELVDVSPRAAVHRPDGQTAALLAVAT